MPTFNLDLIYGAAGEIARRLGAHRPARSLALEPPHVSRVRADGRGRHAARRAAGAPPRRRRPRRQVRARRRAARLARRAGELRGQQLGAPGSRVPAQPAVLAPGQLPRVRLAQRTRHARRPPVVERAHAGAVHRRRRQRASRPRRRARRSTPRPAGSKVCSSRCARARACPSTALDADELDDLVEVDGRAGDARPGAAGCSPTRCRCACAERAATASCTAHAPDVRPGTPVHGRVLCAFPRAGRSSDRPPGERACSSVG